jgi:hypothetical protein
LQNRTTTIIVVTAIIPTSTSSPVNEIKPYGRSFPLCLLDNQPCVDQKKAHNPAAVLAVNFTRFAVADMTAPDTENGQFEEWMVDYEAKLREGVQKRFGLSHGTGDKNSPSDESIQDKDQGMFQIIDEEG